MKSKRERQDLDRSGGDEGGDAAESQLRDERRMTNVVSRAITGLQINSLSKFIVSPPLGLLSQGV